MDINQGKALSACLLKCLLGKVEFLNFSCKSVVLFWFCFFGTRGGGCSFSYKCFGYLLFVFVYVYVYMFVHVCGGQRLTFGVVPKAMLTLFFETGSLSGIWASSIKLSWFTSKSQGSIVSSSPALGLKLALPYLALSHGCWGLNTGPNSCKASILPTELSPQPKHLLFSCTLVKDLTYIAKHFYFLVLLIFQKELGTYEVLFVFYLHIYIKYATVWKSFNGVILCGEYACLHLKTVLVTCLGRKHMLTFFPPLSTLHLWFLKKQHLLRRRNVF